MNAAILLNASMLCERLFKTEQDDFNELKNRLSLLKFQIHFQAEDSNDITRNNKFI